MGLAHGVNLVRGLEESWLGWQPEALDAAVEAAVLRYLAVAHFGRGRGAWAQSEAPAQWRAVVVEALAPSRPVRAALWTERSDEATTAKALQAVLTQTCRQALATLYPLAPVPVPASVVQRHGDR
jgi:hypothetical protein